MSCKDYEENGYGLDLNFVDKSRIARVFRILREVGAELKVIVET